MSEETPSEIAEWVAEQNEAARLDRQRQQIAEAAKLTSLPAGVGDPQLHFLREEVRVLREEVRRLEAEKRRRVYYQDIVYAVCNELDKIRVNDVEGLYRVPGGAVVCGTIEEPSHAVQDDMSKIVKTILHLQSENARLASAIRKHRDQRGDDRCWQDDHEMYAVLPEGFTPPATDTAVELENCKRYIECRHGGTEYVSPQRRIEELEAENASLRAEDAKLHGEISVLTAKLEREYQRWRGGGIGLDDN